MTDKDTDLEEQRRHVDAFIDTAYFDLEVRTREPHLRYAQFILHHMRMPAWMLHAFSEFLEGKRLFCTFEDKRWRVASVSRFGDLCLSDDLSGTGPGYTRRGVYCTDVHSWGPLP